MPAQTIVKGERLRIREPSRLCCSGDSFSDAVETTIAAAGIKKQPGSGIWRLFTFHYFELQRQLLPPATIGAGSGKNFMKTTRLVLAVMTLFAADANAGTEEQLAAHRQQIDSLDQRIVELIQERARVVEEVGRIKREANLPVTVPTREQQVIAKAQELAKGGPLPPEAIGRIYQKLVEEMRNWEAKLDVAAPNH